MAPKTCSIPECERPHHSRTFCDSHYRSAVKAGDAPPVRERESDEARFWAKVDKSGDCWEWTAFVDKNGYGHSHFRGSSIGAHRVSYKMANGSIPDGSFIDHMCHNRSCVNPNHLRLATNAENQQNLSQVPSTNKSGALGVSWSKRVKKWQVSVKHEGKSRHLGYFASLKDAETVSTNARAELFTHFQQPSRLTFPWERAE